MIANLGFINTKCITVGGIYPYEITNSLLIITKNTAFCDILQMPKPCFDGQCNSELQGRCGQDILSIYGFCTELRGYKNINTRSTALSRKTLCRLGQPARIWSIQSFLQILQSDVNGGDSTFHFCTRTQQARQRPLIWGSAYLRYYFWKQSCGIYSVDIDSMSIHCSTHHRWKLFQRFPRIAQSRRALWEWSMLKRNNQANPSLQIAFESRGITLTAASSTVVGRIFPLQTIQRQKSFQCLGISLRLHATRQSLQGCILSSL